MLYFENGIKKRSDMKPNLFNLNFQEKKILPNTNKLITHCIWISLQKPKVNR